MRIAFADVVLDPDAHTLSRNGEFLHLSPKAFELLTLLLEERPRMLRRQEIEDRLWPQTSVGEANVRNLISEIRSAIGETAARAIVTLPRLGYAVRDGSVSAESAFTLTLHGRAVAVREGATVVGRASDCDVVLSASGVSRHHLRITVRGGCAEIADLGSKNGTWLNGSRITTLMPLHDGDEISAGCASLTVHAAIERVTDTTTLA